MQKEKKNEKSEKVSHERESVKFGYGASIVFLLFISYVIYVSLTK